MDINIKKQALKLLEEALTEFETSKGSISSAVLKLSRAANLVNDKQIYLWCQLNLGSEIHIKHLKFFIAAALEYQTAKKTAIVKEKYDSAIANLVKEEILEINENKLIFSVISNEEINLKANQASGGLNDIGFLEEKYNSLKKGGNDGTYYQTNVLQHIQLIRNVGYQKASKLHKKLASDNLVKSAFDILKNAVDDKLLDINPVLAEQIIVAFKSVNSENKEEWSQALVSCRRFLEGLADVVYPATDKMIGGRSLNQSNYINRIWAFMDEKIESDSNKNIAKAHVDFIGNYLQKIYKLTNKGVHSEIDKLDAIKTVFHSYLIVIDILSYLDVKQFITNKNINDATIDELEVILKISRMVAKEIIKQRIENNVITTDLLRSIKGISKKSIEKAIEYYNLE